MLTNAEMVQGRFYARHVARQIYREITECLSRGGQVVIATYGKAWLYKPKHLLAFHLDDKRGRVMLDQGKHCYSIVERGYSKVGIRYGRVA